MKRFTAYVAELEAFASRVVATPDASEDTRIAAVLGPEPAEQLRQLVGLRRRRSLGAFFTTPLLRRELLSDVDLQDAVVLDPACGAGDLLLELSDALPLGNTLLATVEQWGRRLHGADTTSDFVRAARARLTIAAVKRARDARAIGNARPNGTRFPFLHATDGLTALGKSCSRFSHIVLNPPFGANSAPRGCTWADGAVSQAAVFAARAVENARPGATVLAILPDALRSGPRYSQWRSHIEQYGNVLASRPLGQFDEFTDIDVFAFTFVAGRPADHHAWDRIVSTSTVGDYCGVHVGDVVPHRHPPKGPYRRYATTETLPRHGTVSADSLPHRRFHGRVFSPPFVTVRRTSRPEDDPRLVPTIVTGSAAVAVENHLVVLVPTDRSQRACSALAKVLTSPSSTSWLRRYNRCRHVTAHVIRDLPWP